MDQFQDSSFESLLVKYLLQEAEPEEIRRIETWLAADPINRRQYEEIRLIWEKSLLLTPAPLLNEEDDEEERAWQTLREKIREPRRRVSVKTIWWTAVAAVLLPAAVLGFLWWRNASTAWITVASADAIRTDTLADGSVIVLNKHSVLSTNGRTARLEGEAFFRVAIDAHRPFRVQTQGIMITVLGTSFNVTTGEKQTTVTVETGAVSVTNAHGTIRLNAGEKISLGPNDAALEKRRATTPLYEYYRPRDLVCNDTPLWQLVDALNQAYNAHIVIGNPALRELTINTVFHNENLDRILSVISETLRIKVLRSPSTIILQ